MKSYLANALQSNPVPILEPVPEFGNSRRKFLIAMFMIGAVKPERVIERIAAEIEREGKE